MAQPWFKFFAGDFLADQDILCLSMEERGALITLWAFAWREGRIPADDVKIARLLGSDRSAIARLSQMFRTFFSEVEIEGEKRLVSRRMEAERTRAQAKHQERSEAGKRGNESRWISQTVTPDPSKTCDRSAIAQRSQSESESDTEKEPPTPKGEPAAPRMGKAPASGKLFPPGWGEQAEPELQEVLQGYPRKRPNGTAMSNGTPKELRCRWMAIIAANPGVTPRLLKNCAWALLDALGEDNPYLPLLSTLYGPQKATWETYRPAAEERIREQDARELGESQALPLRTLAEVAHG